MRENASSWTSARTQADERHFAFENVEKFAAVVEAGAAENAANVRNPLVAADGLADIRTVFHNGHGANLIMSMVV
jgi:hypothetical protein